MINYEPKDGDLAKDILVKLLTDHDVGYGYAALGSSGRLVVDNAAELTSEEADLVNRLWPYDAAS